MPSIFISYRRTDAPAHAGRLYDRLADRFGEANVFKDVDSMAPGADFQEVIEDTVAHSDALIAVIGRDWLPAKRSGEQWPDHPQDWVRFEIANALKQQIRVVPVLVEGASMPSPAELPEDLQALARRHGVELSETAWTAQLHQLIAALDNTLQPQTKPKPTRQVELQTLRIKTGREGPAASAGHNLVLQVTDWKAAVDMSANASVELTANPASIEVVSASGGAKPLSDRDKTDIGKSITAKVLGTSPITFTSSDLQVDGSTLTVKGELTIAGTSKFISVPLVIADDGAISGSVTLRPSTFGIKPFTAMFGALKVLDSVEVLVEATMSPPSVPLPAPRAGKTTSDQDNRNVADRPTASAQVGDRAASQHAAQESRQLPKAPRPASAVVIRPSRVAPDELAKSRDLETHHRGSSRLRHAALVIYRHPVKTVAISMIPILGLPSVAPETPALVVPWSVLILANLGLVLAKMVHWIVARLRRRRGEP